MQSKTRGLLIVGLSGLALAGGIAAAHPQSPALPIIADQPAPPTPTGWSNPDNQGGPTTPWEGFGMLCQNAWIICG